MLLHPRFNTLFGLPNLGWNLRHVVENAVDVGQVCPLARLSSSSFSILSLTTPYPLLLKYLAP
jgi:hypothetical protein